MASPQPWPHPSRRAAERGAWVTRRLRTFNAGLTPKRRRGKYLAMAASPFTFYRGSDHLYWDDFGSSPHLSTFGSARTRTWLSGDLHIGNIGITGTKPARLTYDLNDFDESVIADYQLDLWRLAISVVLVARQLGAAAARQQDLVTALVNGYVLACASATPRRARTAAVSMANACGPIRQMLKQMASTQSYDTMLARWSDLSHGDRVFAISSNEDLALPTYPVMQDLSDAARTYAARLPRAISVVWPAASIARRLHAGIGSYGVARYYLLVRGRTSSDPMRILDVKEQGPPSAWSRIPAAIQATTMARCRGNHALRTVQASTALSAQIDPLLGWMPALAKTFSVRERTPFKGTLAEDQMTVEVVTQLAAITAGAHGRANPALAQAVCAAATASGQDMAAFVWGLTSSYASQVECDYQSVRKGLRQGDL